MSLAPEKFVRKSAGPQADADIDLRVNWMRWTGDCPMQTADEQEITRLLRQADQGDPSAADALFRCVYDELHQLAAAHFGRQPAGHTLQPTALIHEAYLRLMRGAGLHVQDRQHFF